MLRTITKTNAFDNFQARSQVLPITRPAARRGKIILETNPIMQTTKKYPRTKPKAGRQTSSSDSMTRQREPGTPSQTVGPEMSRLQTECNLTVVELGMYSTKLRAISAYAR